MKGNPHEEGAEVSAPRGFPRSSSIEGEVSCQNSGLAYNDVPASTQCSTVGASLCSKCQLLKNLGINERCLPHTCLWTTPLHFAAMSCAMSNDTFDIALQIDAAINAAYADVFYPQYKVAVYDNLLVGIVYGEGQETCRCASCF